METVKKKVYIHADDPGQALRKIVSQCKSAAVVQVELHLIEGNRYFANIFKTKSVGRGRRLGQIETWQQELEILTRKRKALVRRIVKIDERIEFIDERLSEDEN